MTTSNATVEAPALPHEDCAFEAAVETFAGTCGTPLEVAASGTAPSAAGVEAIVAVISLVGGVEWSLSLGLPKETASALTAKFAGFEIPFDSPDMGDAIGEMANIFAGTAKAKLDQKGVRADISLPTVMRGTMEIMNYHHMPMHRVYYRSPSGPLWVEVAGGRSAVPIRTPGA